MVSVYTNWECNVCTLRLSLTLCCFVELDGVHRDLHGLTHAFPTLRSSGLTSPHHQRPEKQVVSACFLPPCGGDGRQARGSMACPQNASAGSSIMVSAPVSIRA